MRHGGQLKEAIKQFPHVIRSWIDLSTGINPYSYSFLPFSSERLTQLPNIDDEIRLRDYAARSYGVQSKDYIMTAPGTQILISLLPYLFKAQQVCVLCPTYMEHLTSWENAGINVYSVQTLDDFMQFALKPRRVGVICNPNNPDGRFFSLEQMKDILRFWRSSDNHLIVDEAFMDFEGSGIGCLLPHPALTILRSFGKTYGLAGVRLGFMLSDRQNIIKIQQMLGPWAISGMAIDIGLQALSDQEWFLLSKKQLSEQVQQLDDLFKSYGCKVVGGTHLFRLIEYNHAQELWNYLANHGVWVRRFDYNPLWLRFGVPNQQDWLWVEKIVRSYFDDKGYVL